MLDFYQLLGVEENADTPIIKAAYRKKALEYHPDKVAGLGDEIRTLADRKMLLLNEALRILQDPQLRTQYDLQRKDVPDEAHSLIHFICRSCGHSFSLEKENPLRHCPVCEETLEIPPHWMRGGIPGGKDVGEEWIQERIFQDNSIALLPGVWEACLWLLRLSHSTEKSLEGTGDSELPELPSVMQLKLGNLFYGLDCLRDGRFCLFTHFKSMHTHLQEFFGMQADWDEADQIGYCVLDKDIGEAATKLFRLFSCYAPSECSAYISAGERTQGGAEPNILLISAWLDCSFVSAQALWKKSEMNLVQVPWSTVQRNCIYSDLQETETSLLDQKLEHLETLYRLIYGGTRRERRSTTTGAEPISEEILAGDQAHTHTETTQHTTQNRTQNTTQQELASSIQTLQNELDKIKEKLDL